MTIAPFAPALTAPICINNKQSLWVVSWGSVYNPPVHLSNFCWWGQTSVLGVEPPNSPGKSSTAPALSKHELSLRSTYRCIYVCIAADHVKRFVDCLWLRHCWRDCV